MRKLIDCSNHTIVDFSLRCIKENTQYVKNEKGEFLHKNKADYVTIYHPIADPNTGAISHHIKIQLSWYEINKIHSAIKEEENKELYFEEDCDDY